MSSDDFEREREDYFNRISGVGEWQGQRFGWSRWAWDVAWHPAMLKGRSGRAPKSSRWDPFKPLLFLLVVLGAPALAIFLAGDGPSIGVKLGIVLGVLVTVWLAVVVLHATAWRGHRAAPKKFPHPGPKGRHVHR